MARYLALILVFSLSSSIFTAKIETPSIKVEITADPNGTGLFENYYIKKDNEWYNLVSLGQAKFSTYSSKQAVTNWNVLTPSEGQLEILIEGSIDYFLNETRLGKDLDIIELKIGSSHKECQNLCENNLKCGVWTYVKEGFEKSNPRCHLKELSANYGAAKNLFSFSGLSKRLGEIKLRKSVKLLDDINSHSIVYITEEVENLYNYPLLLSNVESIYEFNSSTLTNVEAYSPSIKNRPEVFVPHWQFKSPTVYLQEKNAFFSIVADLNKLNLNNVLNTPTYMDISNDGSRKATLSHGIGHSIIDYHSLYIRDSNRNIEIREKQKISQNYFLIMTNNAEYSEKEEKITSEGYRFIASFLWSKFGSKNLSSSPDSQTNYFFKNLNTFKSWNEDTWLRYAQEKYSEFDCDGEICATLRSERNNWSESYGTDTDMWLNSWFQTLRTAYGMFKYGTRYKDKKLVNQAKAVLNLTLKTPQNEEGAFPTIFWLDKDNVTRHWVYDDGWAGLCNTIPQSEVPADCQDFYHTFHMSWTGYWLLKWNEIVEDTRILPFTIKLGNYLVKYQSESGVIPSFINVKTGKSSEIFREINSETAGSALFLSELYKATKSNVYLNSAKKAMSFIEKEIVPTRKWFDFETFVSCSTKAFSFYDGFTRQYPENNLGKIQAAFTYANLYDITKDSNYLEIGSKIVDYISLAQQVWSHPTFTPNVIGGFTTQNTDAEWSDARQAYAADVYFLYYGLTKKFEYLERGVGALRASFAVFPYENWAHTGGSEGDSGGAITGIHWSSGSTCTSIEMIIEMYRDVYIDVAKLHGVGINGTSVSNITLVNNKLNFNIITKYDWDENVYIVIDGWNSKDLLDVYINEVLNGSFYSEELKKGIPVRLVPQKLKFLSD